MSNPAPPVWRAGSGWSVPPAASLLTSGQRISSSLRIMRRMRGRHSLKKSTSSTASSTTPTPTGTPTAMPVVLLLPDELPVAWSLLGAGVGAGAAAVDTSFAVLVTPFGGGDADCVTVISVVACSVLVRVRTAVVRCSD